MENAELKEEKKIEADYLLPLPKVKVSVIKLEDFPNRAEIPFEEDLDGHVRVVCISDTHCKHMNMPRALPKGDLLIHSGDFTLTGETPDVKNFANWLVGYITEDHFKHIVVIAGNHDITFQENYYHSTGWKRFHGDRVKYDPEKTRNLLIKAYPGRIHYLEDESITLLGVRIYGSPWSAAFHDWAFNVERGKDSEELYSKIPKDTQVLITHGPPAMHGDIVEDVGHQGSVALHSRVTELNIPFHIFGHIHEGYGVTKQEGSDTFFVNASTCTLKYVSLNKPIVFHIARGSKTRANHEEELKVD